MKSSQFLTPSMVITKDPNFWVEQLRKNPLYRFWLLTIKRRGFFNQPHQQFPQRQPFHMLISYIKPGMADNSTIRESDYTQFAHWMILAGIWQPAPQSDNFEVVKRVEDVFTSKQLGEIEEPVEYVLEPVYSYHIREIQTGRRWTVHPKISFAIDLRLYSASPFKPLRR